MRGDEKWGAEGSVLLRNGVCGGVYKWMDGGGWVGTLVEGCTGLCVDLRGVSFGGLDEL